MTLKPSQWSGGCLTHSASARARSALGERKEERRSNSTELDGREIKISECRAEKSGGGLRADKAAERKRSRSVSFGP